MLFHHTSTQHQNFEQRTTSWFSTRKLCSFLLVTIAFCLAPFLYQRWNTKSLVESIRSHGGEVRIDQYVCYNEACFYIPLAVSESLSRITYISYAGSNSFPIDDAFVESMDRQPILCMLKLGDRNHPARITDRGFSVMKQFPELVSLDLTGVPLTESSYKELRQFPSLRYLKLRHFDSQMDRLSGITQLKRLNSLCLADVNITNANLKHVSSLTTLKSIEFSKTNIEKDSFRNLSNMSQLSLMSLHFTKFDPGELTYLTDLTSLQSLHLNGSTITDTHLREASKLSQLTQLHLDETEISDQSLAYLSDMKNLKVLFLANTAISDAGIKHLTQLENLQYLHLGNTKITNQVTYSLLNMPRLVRVRGVEKVLTHESLQALQDAGIEVERDGSYIKLP